MSEAVTIEKQKWTTAKLALAVVGGVINGVVTTPIGAAWVLLNDAFGVIGGAAFQPFVIFPAMVGWLLCRPGVFLIAELTKALVSLLLGGPAGVVLLYWGVAGGLAGELAGYIFRWDPKKRTQIALLYGILYIPLTNIVTFMVFGWQVNTLLWVGLVVSLFAITLESTIPGIAMAKWLAKTGLLRGIGVDVNE